MFYVLSHGSVKRVSGYEEADTAPRGRTAHKHFGGMRARADQRTDAETQWQELQADWPLESPSNRPWATYTTCATVEADVKAQTGVFFRGGRMAGDVHHVTAYVETGTSLDTEDALGGLPAEQTSNTFRFENWRRVEIEGHWKVGPNATDLDLKALNAEYNKAAMEIVPTSNMTKENAREKWLKIIKAAIKYRKKNNLFTRNAVKGTSDKHLVGFKKYEKYRGSSLFDFSEKNSEKG